MDEDNDTFVDVCGEGDAEESKENWPSLANANGRSAGKGGAELRWEGKVEEEADDSGRELTAAVEAGSGSCEADVPSLACPSPTPQARASRKEKSLGKLCLPFLNRVEAEAIRGRDIHLESVARSMSVEKRRIYDIVNVMEALEVMQKTNKSFYKWHGLGRLPVLMHALQSEAQRGELPTRIKAVQDAMCNFAQFVAETSQGSAGLSVAEQPLAEQPNSGTTTASSGAVDAEDAFGPLASRDRCGKNSLAQLCRRFLMVLLCNRRVSLDVVSTMLIKDPDSEGFEPPSRSRCRRLYDIANVLVHMRLVEKVYSTFGTKKIPLFDYRGPEPDANPANAEWRMREFRRRVGSLLCPVADPAPSNVVVDCSSSATETCMPSASSLPVEPSKQEMVAADGQPPAIANCALKSRKRKRQSSSSTNNEPVNDNSSSLIQPKMEPGRMEVAEEANVEATNAKKARRVLGQLNGAGEQQQHHQQQQQQQQKQLPPQLPRPRPLLPSAPGAAIPFPTICQQPAAIFFHQQPPPPTSVLLPASSFCWPAQLAHAGPMLDRLAQQLAASGHYVPMPFSSRLPGTVCHQQPQPDSSSGQPTGKVRHSVQSILGVSQKENIAAGVGQSPRAFKPVASQQQQQRSRDRSSLPTAVKQLAFR